MRVRSRCRTCGRGIDLPPNGDPPPRLCRRHRIRQRLGAFIGTVAIRVREVLVRPVRRMRARAGGRHRASDAVTAAGDPDADRGTQQPGRGAPDGTLDRPPT